MVECNQLQVLQNQAARFVCSAPPRASRIELYEKLEWFSINHTSIVIYKIKFATLREPEYLAGILCQDSRNQRMLPRQNLSFFRIVSASVDHNSDSGINCPFSYEVIKIEQKKWILRNMP